MGRARKAPRKEPPPGTIHHNESRIGPVPGPKHRRGKPTRHKEGRTKRRPRKGRPLPQAGLGHRANATYHARPGNPSMGCTRWAPVRASPPAPFTTHDVHEGVVGDGGEDEEPALAPRQRFGTGPDPREPTGEPNRTGRETAATRTQGPPGGTDAPETGQGPVQNDPEPQINDMA